MIKAIVKIFLALNGNIKKSQIAAGFAWGVLFGLVPAGNFFWITLFIISFFFAHNHGGKLIAVALVKLFLPQIYPLTDLAGWELLHVAALQDFFTMLYNTPFVPFTRFNNTLVAGGIAAGLVLWLPIFLLVWLFIPLYRRTLLPKILNIKLVKALGKTPLISKISNAAHTIQNLSGGLR
jgi:uncharacterized protein (TIGR03546 family)